MKSSPPGVPPPGTGVELPPSGAVMREIAGKLTDAEIEAVSAYLAALRPAAP